MNYTSVFTGQTDDQAVYVDLTYCARGLYQLACNGGRGYYRIGNALYGLGQLYRTQLDAIDALRLADPTQRVAESEATA